MFILTINNLQLKYSWWIQILQTFLSLEQNYTKQIQHNLFLERDTVSLVKRSLKNCQHPPMLVILFSKPSIREVYSEKSGQNSMARLSNPKLTQKLETPTTTFCLRTMINIKLIFFGFRVVFPIFKRGKLQLHSSDCGHNRLSLKFIYFHNRLQSFLDIYLSVGFLSYM